MARGCSEELLVGADMLLTVVLDGVIEVWCPLQSLPVELRKDIVIELICSGPNMGYGVGWA